MCTPLGSFDIELFYNTAPLSTADFGAYAVSDRLDWSFITKATHGTGWSGSSYILGGKYTLTASGVLSPITLLGTVGTEFSSRSNVAGTICLTHIGTTTEGGVEWYINTVDNPQLNPPVGPAGGYVPFGRVIQGWDVVLAISNLRALDLASLPPFAGPNSADFHRVPVADSYIVNSPITTNDLMMVDATFYAFCASDVDDGNGTGRPDGGVTVDDLLYFINQFDQGNTVCDLDNGSGLGRPDGGVTLDDLLYFLQRFEIGC